MIFNKIKYKITNKVEFMLKFILPIFAAIGFQVSFHVHAADHFTFIDNFTPADHYGPVPHKELVPVEELAPLELRTIRKEDSGEDKEDIGNLPTDIVYCIKILYGNSRSIPESIAKLYAELLLSPTPSIEALRRIASDFVLVGKMEKAREIRKRIVGHKHATTDDLANFLLSFTFLPSRYSRPTSSLGRYRGVIEEACEKLEKSEPKGNSSAIFLFKKTIAEAKTWLNEGATP